MKIVKTDKGYISGAVIGESDKKIYVYRAIPYALPPVGNLRWKPPQPVPPWTGVRDCIAYSTPAAQTDGWLPASIVKSEDCLYLNILTPAKKVSDVLPVMIWMHGGGYSTGTGNAPYCNLPELPKHGVVLVTVNMRLDMLGLLAHPLLGKESPKGVSGNYMFLDMIAALKWVNKNIFAFGGDPDNITIFGNSGGGAKVSVLMSSPLARGLFHRAICESGVATPGFLPGLPLKDMEILGEKFFNKLGVDKEEDPLQAARTLPWVKIISALGGKLPVADATVDGWFLTDTPANIFRSGKQHKIPFITVANLGEITRSGGAYFPHFISGYTNMLVNAGKAEVRGYAAIFEHVPSRWKAEGIGAIHALEIPYIFGDMNYKSDIWRLASYVAGNPKNPELNQGDRKLSEEMMTMWVQFAKTGDPNVKGLITWPAYNATTDQYLALDEPLRIKNGFSMIK